MVEVVPSAAVAATPDTNDSDEQTIAATPTAANKFACRKCRKVVFTDAGF